MFLFSEFFTRTTVGLMEKAMLFPVCLIWNLMGYINDHRPDALKTEVTANFLSVELISTNFDFEKKICPK